MSEHRATSSRNARATSSESADLGFVVIDPMRSAPAGFCPPAPDPLSRPLGPFALLKALRWHRCRHLPQRHDFRTADVQKLYGLREVSSHLHVARQDYRAGNGSANANTARAESVRA